MAIFINYDDVDFVWVSDHYDIHLRGLCRHNGELCEFETDWESEKVEIKPLSVPQKLRWLLSKKLFEWFVGYHWTYKNGKRMEEVSDE